jgi:hypothetical protein
MDVKDTVVPPVAIEWLRVDELHPDQENPNEEDPEVFAGLVAEIRRRGFRDPVRVTPRAEGGYWRVGGKHRVDAAVVLGMDAVPCVVEEMDEDERKMEMVADNVRRGKINPFKFTRVFNKLRKQYDPDYLRSRMGIVSERVWKQLYRDVRKGLPPEIRKRLDKVRQEIDDVDTLASVIKRVFTEYGEQLNYNFLVFEYGGKSHVMVKMNDRTKKNVDRIIEECLSTGTDINGYINLLLERDTGTA